MSALHKNLVTVTELLNTKDTGRVPAANDAVTTATTARHGAAKQVALLVAAPFIGLSYVLFFPVIGIAMLATLLIMEAAKVAAVRKALTFVKNAGLFFAAPFVGLAYVVMFPFIGLGIAAAMGYRALRKVPAAAKAIETLKPVGLLIAAPFIGLAFIAAIPFIGPVLLARIGVGTLTGKLAAV